VLFRVWLTWVLNLFAVGLGEPDYGSALGAQTMRTVQTAADLNAMAKKEIEKAINGVPADYLKGIGFKKLTAFQPKGCSECGGVGYKGRIGIFEVLPMTPEIQELVLTKLRPIKFTKAAFKNGVITMKQDGILKVCTAKLPWKKLSG
jgi:hypothetical protein